MTAIQSDDDIVQAGMAQKLDGGELVDIDLTSSFVKEDNFDDNNLLNISKDVMREPSADSDFDLDLFDPKDECLDLIQTIRESYVSGDVSYYYNELKKIVKEKQIPLKDLGITQDQLTGYLITGCLNEINKKYKELKQKSQNNDIYNEIIEFIRYINKFKVAPLMDIIEQKIGVKMDSFIKKMYDLEKTGFKNFVAKQLSLIVEKATYDNVNDDINKLISFIKQKVCFYKKLNLVNLTQDDLKEIYDFLGVNQKLFDELLVKGYFSVSQNGKAVLYLDQIVSYIKQGRFNLQDIGLTKEQLQDIIEKRKFFIKE